ncbi:MAG: PKD domain-containing protein, partial [Bacteroidia bacterium]|nr:PKD domain-containing protein [Bacteroidia bacterium]
ASNLAATGADGGSYPLCAPVADFNPQPQYICAGTSLTFKDMSWNGDVSSWDWTFQGGTPSSSNDTNPVITYYTPGDYSVTLTVTNAAGSSTKTITNLVRVATATGTVNAYPFTESFESGNFPPAEWYVDNESLNTNEWELTSLASHSGFNSVMLNNITGNTNGVDELITTTFDFSNVTNPKLTFWRAFAMTNSTGTPRLRVMVSTDCGKLWSVRYNRSASQITTAPVYSGNFIPTVAQWAKDSTSSLNAAYSGKQNVRFKFEYTQDGGNNIYLDDINIDGVLGINENSVNSSLSVYPNPSIAQSKVEFELDQNAEVSIEIHDLSGRVVQTLTKSILPQGSYVYDIFNLSPGSYTVTVTANHVASTRKLIIQ